MNGNRPCNKKMHQYVAVYCGCVTLDIVKTMDLCYHGNLPSIPRHSERITHAVGVFYWLRLGIYRNRDKNYIKKNTFKKTLKSSVKNTKYLQQPGGEFCSSRTKLQYLFCPAAVIGSFRQITSSWNWPALLPMYCNTGIVSVASRVNLIWVVLVLKRIVGWKLNVSISMLWLSSCEYLHCIIIVYDALNWVSC